MRNSGSFAHQVAKFAAMFWAMLRAMLWVTTAVYWTSKPQYCDDGTTRGFGCPPPAMLTHPPPFKHRLGAQCTKSDREMINPPANTTSQRGGCLSLHSTRSLVATQSLVSFVPVYLFFVCLYVNRFRVLLSHQVCSDASCTRKVLTLRILQACVQPCPLLSADCCTPCHCISGRRVRRSSAKLSRSVPAS